MNKNHGAKYWIINTSERATYNKQKFGNRVTDYHWPDHHGPPFNYMYRIAQLTIEWIRGKSNPISKTHFEISRPPKRYRRALQLRQRPHRNRYLCNPALSRLLRFYGRLSQILQPLTIRMWQRCELTVPASVPLLFRRVLQEVNQITNRQETSCDLVRRNPSDRFRRLRPFF